MSSVYVLCFAQILLCALSNRERTCELNSLFLPRCLSSAGTRTSHIKNTYRSVPLLVMAKEMEVFFLFLVIVDQLGLLADMFNE